MTFDQAIARFREHLRAERGASAHTIDAYRSDLAQFAVFLRRQGAGMSRKSKRSIEGQSAPFSAALREVGPPPSPASSPPSAPSTAFWGGKTWCTSTPVWRWSPPR